MIVLDLETDGLWPNVTKIHCAVAIDVDSGVIIKFVPDYIEIPEEQIGDHEFLSYISILPEYLHRHCVMWEQGLSCHNGIDFDLKVLKSILGYEYKGVYFDTLLASRILWPDIEGGHSVDAWGERFGMQKPKHEDWSEFSEDMLHRCTEDAKIQVEIYKHIQKHITELQENDPRIDFDKIFRLEHRVWEIMERQYDYGWKIDLEHAFRTKDVIEREYEDLRKQLVETLPIRVIAPKTENKITKAFTKSGEITAIADKYIPDIRQLGGDFCKVKFEKTNPGSPDQIKEYLLSQGWQPLNWNYKKDNHGKPVKDKYGNKIKTSPKMPKDEEWEIIEQLTDNPKIKLIAKFYVVRHRKGLINSFIENCDSKTHRIHYNVITCGTNTARMQHKIVVNVPRVE